MLSNWDKHLVTEKKFTLSTLNKENHGIPDPTTTSQLLELGCVFSKRGVSYVKEYILSYVGQPKDWGKRHYGSESRCRLRTQSLNFENDHSLYPALWAEMETSNPEIVEQE